MPTEYFLPHIARMEGYIPGEQPPDQGVIKLNTNENPYPPSAQVLDRVRAACEDTLRLYPDSQALSVRRRLSEIFGVAPEETLVGNGSDELLNIIVRCFVDRDQAVVYPSPTYSYYATLIQMQGARAVEVEFDENYALPPDLVVESARLTLIANPNSPSGTVIPGDQIGALAARTSGIVVVDEAYVDFAQGGCIDLIHRHPNTVVLRTMSKSFSLAGMRLGFGFAAAELVAGMWKVKEHYNVNRLSLVAAEAALDDIESMRENAVRISRTREHLTTRLRELGFSVWDSSANFVLARIQSPPAARLYRELKARGILVRHFDRDRLRDCLRITVGTDGEVGALLSALEDLTQV